MGSSPTPATNFSGFTYDNAGNMTFDGLYSYSWDAENHLKSANGVNYTYDGSLRRVEKSNGKLYWYSSSGQILEETDLSGNLISDYVYFGGQRLARKDSSGSVYFYFTDPLGTVRGVYNSGSSLCYDADFYPFGGEKVHTNTCAQNYKFTGLERDAESGLDNTLNRKYSSSLGRWLEVDPVRGCPAHPQGLNRYVYVRDNPTSVTDPHGDSLAECDPNCQDLNFNIDNPDICGSDCPPCPDPLNCPYGEYGGGGDGGGGGGGGNGGNGFNSIFQCDDPTVEIKCDYCKSKCYAGQAVGEVACAHLYIALVAVTSLAELKIAWAIAKEVALHELIKKTCSDPVESAVQTCLASCDSNDCECELGRRPRFPRPRFP